MTDKRCGFVCHNLLRSLLHKMSLLTNYLLNSETSKPYKVKGSSFDQSFNETTGNVRKWIDPIFSWVVCCRILYGKFAWDAS
jgi:hypothetical protein